MSNTNQYGSFLDKLRAKNLINSIKPPNNEIIIQGPNSFVCVPPSNVSNQQCNTNNNGCNKNTSTSFASLNVVDLTVSKINDLYPPIGIVAQTLIYNKKIILHINEALEKDQNNIISGNTPFTILSQSKTRYIRINVSLIIVDPTPNICGKIFITIVDATNNNPNYNIATEYMTSTSNNFTKIISFEHYLTISANVLQNIYLFATATSNSCFISKNIGLYDDDLFPIGPSYLTITDIGGY